MPGSGKGTQYVRRVRSFAAPCCPIVRALKTPKLARSLALQKTGNTSGAANNQ